MAESNPGSFDDLRALFINCTLKRSPRRSHTEGLMQVSMEIMQKQGVTVEYIRAVDHEIPPGVYPDMTTQGYERDEWPAVFEKVMAADILVLGSPIWLGERSSVCTKIIERLYSNSGQQNEKGQYIYYGRTGGCIITGNEDGVKHCSMGILYALQHIGYVVPPQADAGWIGEVGPGPSYLDEESDAQSNEFTNRNTTFMTYNLLHTARLLKDNDGLPSYGNSAAAWKKGERYGHPFYG